MTTTPEDLARKGYYLFPCKGKTPLVKWSKRSTTDIPTIQRWKAQHPGCSWGIDCGKSGLFVIDDDRGKNAEAEKSLLALELDYGSLPEAFTVRTRSGGYHYYYKGHGRNSAGNKLGPGLDTRGKGGYVVAPCSEGYEVVKDLPVPEVPSWVIDLVGKPSEKEERTNPADLNLDTPAALLRASGYLLDAAPAIEGQYGDDRTYQVACQVRDFGVSEDKCLELMTRWNEACQPPWDTEELEVKVANAYSYAANDLGALSADTVFAKFVDPARSAMFIEGTELLSREIKVEYLIHALVETPSTGLIFGASTAGKTFVGLDMALSVACGTSWMGQFARQGIVVYFAGEGRQGLQRRIKAWLQHYGLELPTNHLFVSERRIEFSTASMKAVAEELQEIQEKTGLPIRACFVDTLARHIPSNADENSARDIGGFINAVDWLRDQFNCVVAIIHHLGKVGKETARGSSALKGAMDWEFRVDEVKGVRSIVWTKQKESEIPRPMGFDLLPVDLGGDIASAVPVMCKYNPTHGKLKNPSAYAEKALEILQMCISADGGSHIPEETWRDDFYRYLEKEGKLVKNSYRGTFNRVKTELEKGRVIERVNGHVFDVSLDLRPDTANSSSQADLAENDYAE